MIVVMMIHVLQRHYLCEASVLGFQVLSAIPIGVSRGIQVAEWILFMLRFLLLIGVLDCNKCFIGFFDNTVKLILVQFFQIRAISSKRLRSLVIRLGTLDLCQS